jgi:hypothetical protein
MIFLFVQKEDLEDRMDLSWLFDFKLGDLPHLSPEEKKISIQHHQQSQSANRTASVSEEDDLHDNDDEKSVKKYRI